MKSAFRRLASSAALLATLFSPHLHAAVITFEGSGLTGIYFPGESFAQAGFVMTQGFDVGLVDTGQALGPVAPTNNTTQFYVNSNDGDCSSRPPSGDPFSLNGFSAAFVPLFGSSAPAQTIGLVALATTMTGAQFGTIFGLGDTSSATRARRS